MPISPGITSTYLPIASITPETLQLCITVFTQGVGVVSGLLLSCIVAVTWKG